jgi:hypothetical protein
MIFAELRSKLGVNYSRAHERAEDLLTSTVFGLLRYLTPADGLLAILRRARPARVDGGTVLIRPDPDWLEVSTVAFIGIDFWPYWPGYPPACSTGWPPAGAGSRAAGAVARRPARPR